jgi:hypothetical protein
MKAIAKALAALFLLAANSAAAAERFDCREWNSVATIVEIDRTGKIFSLTEVGKKNFESEPVCSLLARMAGGLATGSSVRCTIAFGKDVIAADYVGTKGSVSFTMAIALGMKDLRMTAIGRIGTTSGFTRTVPCTRL